MNAKAGELVRAEVADLVKVGNNLLSLAAGADSELTGGSLAEVMAWVSRAGDIIQRVGGDGSAYHDGFQRALQTKTFSYIHSRRYEHLCEILGVLQGLQHALEHGLLQDMRRLLQADIFVDFLTMAEHLLGEGYKDAAAVLIGGVLEDGLRKLSEAHKQPLSNPQGKLLTIDPMNSSLARTRVYEPLTQKQITTWAEVRNRASHGQYDKYGVDDVKQMLQFVQRFLEQYLK